MIWSAVLLGELVIAELYVANNVQRWTLSAFTCASVGAGGAVWAGCAVAWLNTATIPPPIPALISAVAAIKAARRPRPRGGLGAGGAGGPGVWGGAGWPETGPYGA